MTGGVVCRDLFKVHRTAEGDAAALQGLTVDAAPGEMLAVLGPSGSGKSTLLRILAGLERPSAGTAVVAGLDIGRLSAARRAAARRALIGFVGQHAERALSPALTVAEAVALPLRLRGETATEAAGRAGELLDHVGLADAGAARAYDLSGGERQRAAVCAAIAHRPSVVLADEPTGELDADSAGAVLRLLRALADDGATVVLATHDPIGASTAHRLVRIRDGRVSSENDHEVVIGRGGWLHIPEHLLARAGIADRAAVEARDGAVRLTPPRGLADTPAAARATSAGPVVADPAIVLPAVPAAVRAVHKAYRSRIVFRGLDARFAPGALSAVVGRSGSGKSTLLRMLAGLERPDGGDVEVGGEPLHGKGREELAALRRLRIGVVGQEPRLAPFLSAEEHVALAPALAGVDRDVARDLAGRWLVAVGLGDRAGQRVGRLSAGERQRVVIARAFAAGRSVLLVDEPTSRLDESNAAAIAELLAAAAHVHGATVVCATHDPVLADAADVQIALDAR
jgi:energy-coupling factor transport system ATP-binding protein